MLMAVLCIMAADFRWFAYLLVRGWKSRVTQHRRTRVLMTLRAWGRLEHVTLGERKKLQKFPYCVVLFL